MSTFAARGLARLLPTTLAAAILAAGCDGTDPGLAGPPPRSCQSADVGASSLTHLTRVEIGNAAHDLFGAPAAGVTSQLPVDDATSGFEVGVATSPLLAEQYLAVAESVASAQAPDDPAAHALTGCADASESCVSAYAARVGRRAFRRELTDVERSDLGDLFRSGVAAAGFAGGVRLVVEAILTSPDFLYHTEGSVIGAEAGALVTLTPNERAGRLAFVLWRSVPDDALLDDAASGRLETTDDLARAAERMFHDERASRMIEDFYRQWLRLDGIDASTSDELTDVEIRAMHLDLSVFAERTTRNGSFRDLLVPVDGGISSRPNEPARGVLNAPGILFMLSRQTQTDPIHRGLFVRERLLCQHLPPPPPGVVFSVPPSTPGLTTRQRFAVHTGQAACAGCHTLMDPIGFGFEHYDHLGRYRNTEGPLPIDATGEIIAGDDASGTFDGATELASRLVQSDVAPRCFARQWFRFAMQRVETESDACSIDTMMDAFRADDLRIETLFSSVVLTPAFQQRRIAGGN